jgi:hypothetical protein
LAALSAALPTRRNAIINGGFDFWQRGTSFSIATDAFWADRFQIGYQDISPSSQTYTRQTFTPGTAPVAGYEAQFFARAAMGTLSSGSTWRPFQTRIEDARTFAGQTVTLSFWAKSDSTRAHSGAILVQSFGTGGSAETPTGFQGFTTTTSWQRFSFTFDLPSVAGKTIGANSFLYAFVQVQAATGSTFDTWGWQLEAGSVATPFSRAATTLQGELAACQRYYYRTGNAVANEMIGTGAITDANYCYPIVYHPVTMRTSPSFAVSATSDFLVTDGTTAGSPSAIVSDVMGPRTSALAVVRSGLALGRAGRVLRNGSASGAFMEFSAEL